MPKLTTSQLELERCPHCNVDSPLLIYHHNAESKLYEEAKRLWCFYVCSRCGGFVSAWGLALNAEAMEMFPASVEIDEALPEKARMYLEQALRSLSAPAGAVMLAASTVDAMLKGKGLKEGSLYSRIDKAATEHLITREMAAWAHEVRLDANDQRHADDSAPLPDTAGAKRAVEFVLALAQFMFVLPARVQRGIADAKEK